MDDQEDIGTLKETSGRMANFGRNDIIYTKYCIYRLLGLSVVLYSLSAILYCRPRTPLRPVSPPIRSRTPVIAILATSHSFSWVATGGLHHHERRARSPPPLEVSTTTEERWFSR